MKISPGPAAAQMRAARFTVPPKKSPPSWIGSPVLMPMPMAIRVPVWFRFALPRASWIATAQMIAPFAVVKATMKLSPWVFFDLAAERLDLLADDRVVLQEHNAIVRKQIETFDGQGVKTQRDSFRGA